jgi:hypothetical protein
MATMRDEPSKPTIAVPMGRCYRGISGSDRPDGRRFCREDEWWLAVRLCHRASAGGSAAGLPKKDERYQSYIIPYIPLTPLGEEKKANGRVNPLLGEEG